MSESTDNPEVEASAPVDPQVQAFDALCGRLGGFAEHVHTEWVDGYLTALAVSWRAIPLEEALPLMLDDAFERAFAAPEERSDALAVFQQRLQTIRGALNPEKLLEDSQTLRLGPLMQEWTPELRADMVNQGLATKEEAEQLLTGTDWGMGFLAAVDDFSADWPAPDPEDDAEGYEVFEQLLECVGALVMEPGSEAFQAFAAKGWKNADPSRDELIDEACFAVQDLRLWWLDHGPKQAPRRVDAQPGRNDPCPCGSGKKFKKCHGA